MVTATTLDKFRKEKLRSSAARASRSSIDLSSRDRNPGNSRFNSAIELKQLCDIASVAGVSTQRIQQILKNLKKS